ncbi:MAG: glycosyltransferase [Candidatus Aceula meridiana]|nr:glycosyltransferase [Candidatus Aceula meridiana]
MNILIYGEECWYGVVPPLKKAFESFGAKTDVFDWTQYLFRSKQVNMVNRILDRAFLKNVSAYINQAFLKQAKERQYDIIFILQGGRLCAKTILSLRDVCSCIANWNIDDFFNSKVGIEDAMSFQCYDLIFSARKHLFEEYYARGARRMEHLDWFYYSDRHFPIVANVSTLSQWTSDIVFLGTWSRHREKVLSRLDGFHVSIWGNYWHRADRAFRNKFRILYKEAWFQEMSQVVNSSQIVLDVLTKENRDKTNLKTFQIPACGGFLLTERTEEILELFGEGKEVACYGSEAEMISNCNYYLAHETERQQIAGSAYAKLMQGKHTLQDRARKIFDVCCKFSR